MTEMYIVIAPDSFKESATAPTVARAIAEGLERVWPHAQIVTAPMADGGEGTMETVIAATNGTVVACAVQNALGRRIPATYGITGDKKTAVIDMAAASGLPQIAPPDRDPAIATTFGTGELMLDALRRGVDHLVIGMGGSATNDAGTGMATALGYAFLDGTGKPLPPGGLALAKLKTIDASGADPLLNRAHIQAAYDVDVPLYGPASTSTMFAQQKGADASTVQNLDEALHHFADVVREQIGIDVTTLPGGGAAGGLGAGLAAFAEAALVSGVEWVSRAIDLETKIQHADLIITGEGKLDAQTRHGKVPAGVAALAHKHGVPVVAFAGYVDAADDAEIRGTFDRIVPLCTEPTEIPDAMRHTAQRLTEKADAFARDWDRMIKSHGE
jgi:glycerate 2-kinase